VTCLISLLAGLLVAATTAIVFATLIGFWLAR
jgi:hypothetical protein